MELPDGVAIRPAALSDLDAIVSLWLGMMREHEAFDSRVRLGPSAGEAYENYARHYVTRSDAPVFVAEHDGEVIAFGLAYRARNLPMFLPDHYGFLSDLVVTPSWRGRGIGTALVGEITRQLRAQDVTHVQLQVYHNNARARAFWHRVGFTEFVHGLWLDIGK